LITSVRLQKNMVLRNEGKILVLDWVHNISDSRLKDCWLVDNFDFKYTETKNAK